MAVMDSTQVLAQRLGTQRLSSAPLPRAADAVRLLTCVQSQERDHAFSSLGMRSRKDRYGAVQREFYTQMCRIERLGTLTLHYDSARRATRREREIYAQAID